MQLLSGPAQFPRGLDGGYFVTLPREPGSIAAGAGPYIQDRGRRRRQQIERLWMNFLEGQTLVVRHDLARKPVIAGKDVVDAKLVHAVIIESK